LQFYKPERPSYENVLFQVIGKNSLIDQKNRCSSFFLGCVTLAASKKIKGQSRNCQNWIDGAIGKYSEQFVRDVSAFLNVMWKGEVTSLKLSLNLIVDAETIHPATNLLGTASPTRLQLDIASDSVEYKHLWHVHSA
jgi:hypothetical protein